MVMFRWIPEATREQKEQVKEELGRLPALIPQVRAFHLGEDLGLVGDVNFDFALVADFDDLAGYLAYRESAEHKEIVETYVQPIAGARGAVQYEI
jgi:stress responsive alpha/beta barrel protein